MGEANKRGTFESRCELARVRNAEAARQRREAEALREANMTPKQRRDRADALKALAMFAGISSI